MKRTRVVAIIGLLGLATALGACGSTSPAAPTLGAPTLVSPAAGASIIWSAQPITMVVTNVSGASASATYVFEVATDSAFTVKVSTKTVAAGASGQTSAQADTLAANATYFWRARLQDGSTTGSFSIPNAFSIGQAIVISAPTPVRPVNGFSANGWPTLTVNNAVRSGPSGVIVYKFEIASNSAFSAIVISATVAEGLGQTSYLVSSSQDASVGTTFYWRVTATDQTYSLSSAPSATQSFTDDSLARGMAAEQGFTLWPGVKPSGTSGHAQIGSGWDLVTRVSPLDGVRVTTPTLENLRILDLIDRGMDAPSAVNWLQQNYGAPSALYYGGIVDGVIAFFYSYMAKTNGQWELVFRVGA